MKKFKLVALLSFIMIVSITMVGCGNKDNGKAPDPGGDFSYDFVTVLLTESASAIDREWTPADFPEFAFSRIDNHGLIGSQKYMSFYLVEPSRDNVLKAIYQLNKRTEVFIAEVSGFDSPA